MKYGLAVLLLGLSPVPLMAEAGPDRLTFSWPVENPVIEHGFGTPDDDSHAMQGIGFAAKEASTIVAVADGTALYAGPFRSYGSLLILDHGCGLNSILAGALRPSVAIGEKVRRGEPVGSVTAAAKDRMQIYFELRRDGIATNPDLVMPELGSTTPRSVNCADVKTAEASAAAQTGQPASESASALPEPGPPPTATKIVWTGKWPWPARGDVIRAFKVDGNDGIDIAMPEGTDIKTVEKGIVIYAGDGLTSFGNAMLVRHEDGLVTVYGHLSELKKKRGEKVRRGDVIGKSGQTGAAPGPQLHFEVRKQSKPVDPAAYLSEP